MDRNSWINLFLIGTTAFLSWNLSIWFLLIPIIFHLLNDLIQWKLGWSIFNTDIMVKRTYQVVHSFLFNQTNAGLDLGFNFYEGNLERKRSDAQKSKWDYMLQELGLKPGDKLIDIGCGYGDWIRYAKEKGILVKGVNLSKVQADTAKKKYDLDVINVNWKEILQNPLLQKDLFGQFDAVTFMDTIEHYVSPTARRNPEVQKKIYSDMFHLAYSLLKSSSKGRVFFSCLHQIKQKFNFRMATSVWLLNRTMSGFYPFGDQGLTQYSTPYFKEVKRIDRTEDYRLTAVLEKDHFQTKKNFKINLKYICKAFAWIVLDPYFIHRLLGILIDHWMYCYGPDWNERRYDPEKRSKVSVVRLWMVTLEKNYS